MTSSQKPQQKKINITIPEESFICIEPIIDGHQALTIINTSLKQFEYKEAFAWNLAIFMDFEDAEENGMPKGTAWKESSCSARNWKNNSTRL